MAAPIVRSWFASSPPLKPLFSQVISSLTADNSYIQCRFASKTAGGISKNKRQRTRQKHRGIKVSDGEDVQRGTILCTQLQLRYYPGENVRVGGKMTLNALVDGKVMITKETLNPYPDSPIYPGVKSGEVIERIFLHVLPNPQHNRFRLKSLI